MAVAAAMFMASCSADEGTEPGGDSKAYVMTTLTVWLRHSMPTPISRCACLQTLPPRVHTFCSRNMPTTPSTLPRWAKTPTTTMW